MRAEHQAKRLRVLERKSYVCPPDGSEACDGEGVGLGCAPGSRARPLHSSREGLEAGHRDRGEQRRLVTEVPIGRVRRNADQPGGLSQAEAFRAALAHETGSHLDQGVAQIAVMVAAAGGTHAASVDDVNIGRKVDGVNIEASACRSAVGLSLLISAMASACVPANERTQHRVAELRVDTIRLEYANAHLVRVGAHAFLVDSGSRETTERLASELSAAGVEPASLEAVIVTHGHADHAGGAAYLQSLGVPIIAGRGDREMLLRGSNDELCPTDDTARGRLASDGAARFDGLEADVWIEQATPLAPHVGIEGEISPVAGHTPGSLVVTVGNALFVGDLVRGEILSDGADVHFYMCDLVDNRRDLQALLHRTPHASRWFVGHFGPLRPDHVRDLLRERWGELAPSARRRLE